MTDYDLLCRQLEALLEGEPDAVANYSNAAALLKSELPRLNWAGFYFVKPSVDGTKEELVLGPFQGLPACIRLPHNRGVCGTAWARGESVVVADVHAFPGHIACDSASASEIVVPLVREGKVYGVLDLDSPAKGRFDETDRVGLEQFCRVLENRLPKAAVFH